MAKNNMYVNIHSHTHFSVLDGLTHPEDLAKRVKEWGMPAVAITDHGNIAGIPEFYMACQENGVKPILGIETYMVPDLHVKKTFRSPTGKEVRTGYHLILLAKNFVGYRNLIQLSNLAHVEGFYYSPKIDWESLLKHKEGLIVTSACVASEIGQICLTSQDPHALAAKFKSVWGDDYYFEVMDNGMQADVQRIINKRLIGLGKSMDIKIIPTNDSHYLDAEEQKMHDLAICMKSKKVLSDPKRLKYDGLYHVKTIPEMARLFPEYMANTLEIAEKVEEFEIFDKNAKLPLSVGDSNQILRMITQAGLAARGLSGKVYVDRLNYELAVIQKMGFSAYMLTIKEVIDLIRTHDCPIGWGRGSAGGSLICYVLDITDVDPIQHGLLFERFISEHRPDWPDIDVDISRDKRDMIIAEIIKKYGSDKVSHISTFLYLKPKMLIRDICRAAEKPIAMADALSRMVPAEASTAEDLEGTEIHTQLCKTEDGKAIWRYLKGLLGIPRHVGTHASGIVISSATIADHLPIRQAEDKNVIEYSMHNIDKFGFLKFDLLGVETLDLIFETAKEVGIDIKRIPLDDEKTYQMIGEGRILGLFQLDKSRTCLDICKRMKPKNIRDLADIIALNRPGVLDAGLLDVYLRRRDGMEKAQYIHPDLKAILEPSFGVCIYQEDLMRMAAIYAGYTPLEVESLRKGVGKKDTSIIDKHLVMFKEKALALGRDPQEIDVVLTQVEAAGRYSFNKSHAVAYAMVTYACGYLAANYPLNFFKNVINHSDDDSRPTYLSEALMRKINLLPPDINTSSGYMEVERDENGVSMGIRWGLLFIKGIGDAGVKKIMEGRPYKSMRDVAANVGRATIAILHSAHALGSVSDAKNAGIIAKASEVEVLGIPFSGMLNEYADIIERIKAVPVANIVDSGTCVIQITKIKKHIDKNKHKMAFCEGFDVYGPKIENLIMFASVYETFGDLLRQGAVYGAILSKLNNGGWQLKGVNDVASIRKQEPSAT